MGQKAAVREEKCARNIGYDIKLFNPVFLSFRPWLLLLFQLSSLTDIPTFFDSIKND